MSAIPWIRCTAEAWQVPSRHGTIAWTPTGRSRWTYGPYTLAMSPHGWWHLTRDGVTLRMYDPRLVVSVALYLAGRDIRPGAVAPDYDADPAVVACGL